VAGALEGIKVLEIVRVPMGAVCTMMLADMGAEVIKVERPGTGEPVRAGVPFAGPGGIRYEGRTKEDIGLVFLKRNRGKKSISLDMKSPPERLQRNSE
jgi:crotonobetainyl-CoA:carnitine CoA-transferase CaiB-like acyl-CoA transferase